MRRKLEEMEEVKIALSDLCAKKTSRLMTNVEKVLIAEIEGKRIAAVRLP